jgi:hypothetical protein
LNNKSKKKTERTQETPSLKQRHTRKTENETPNLPSQRVVVQFHVADGERGSIKVQMVQTVAVHIDACCSEVSTRKEANDTSQSTSHHYHQS